MLCKKPLFKQENIPVGRVPPACPRGVGYGLGGTVPRGKVWGYSPGGVQSQEVGSGGLVLGYGRGMALPTPVDRMTDACENIAFPQLRWLGGKYWLFHEKDLHADENLHEISNPE